MSEEDRYRIEKVEADKKVRREQRQDADDTPKPFAHSNFLLIAFATLLKRITDTYSPKNSRVKTVKKADSIYDTLFAFKKHLEALKINDHITDSHYTQTLSELWNHLLEHFDSLHIRHPDRTRFKTLIETINNFPPNEHRSLGFYLTNYAGDKWLPFPFLDILRHLFKDYSTKREESHLAHLINQINSILPNRQP